MDHTELNLTKFLQMMNETPGLWIAAVLLLVVISLIVSFCYEALVTRSIAYTVAEFATPFVILVAAGVTMYVGVQAFSNGDRNTTLSDQIFRLTMTWCYPFAIMGSYTFLLIIADKWNAVFNRANRIGAKPDAWQVPESTLHRCEFLGGTLGSFLAQHLFRHKVSKRSYQFTFWAIVSTQFFVFLMGAISFTQWSYYWSLACIVPAAISLEMVRFSWTARDWLNAGR